MPRPILEFWFDFASTYSYPAAMRIEDLARKAEVDVSWRPFLLGPLFNSLQGLKDSPFNVVPASDSLPPVPSDSVAVFSGDPPTPPSATT